MRYQRSNSHSDVLVVEKWLHSIGQEMLLVPIIFHSVKRRCHSHQGLLLWQVSVLEASALRHRTTMPHRLCCCHSCRIESVSLVSLGCRVRHPIINIFRLEQAG